MADLPPPQNAGDIICGQGDEGKEGELYSTAQNKSLSDMRSSGTLRSV